MIEAVIFDIGGPLDTEVEKEAALDADIREALAREGIEVDDAHYHAAERFAIETCAPNVYRAIIWYLTGRDAERSLRIYAWVVACEAERDLFELRPDILSVLAALKQRGLKLGLASNEPEAVLRRMAEHGIGSFFDNHGVAGVHGFRKPDVRAFLQACEDLDVEPNACIMVGDRIDNDIVPAKHLGMRTVRIRTGRHRTQEARSWDELPDAEVEDSADLLRAIESLIEAFA